MSCSTTKKTAVACPEFSIYKNNKVATNYKRITNKVLTSHNKVNTKKQVVSLSKNSQEIKIAGIKKSSVSNKDRELGIQSASHMNKSEYSVGLIASIDNVIIPLRRNNMSSLTLTEVNLTDQPNDLIIIPFIGCDTIILKSGTTIIGKVEEIGQNEIKYRKCNNLTGPIISISKSEAVVILYSNGTRDIFASNNPTVAINNNVTPTIGNNTPNKTEGLAIAGFISSLAGLIVFPIPLGAIGVIFGAISLSRISKNPSKLKGKGLAITSLIIGAIDIVVGFLLLSLLLA